MLLSGAKDPLSGRVNVATDQLGPKTMPDFWPLGGNP
jgi:hypothetical protein